MKLCFVLTFVCVFQLSAAVHSQKTTFSLKLSNVSIEEVFIQIKKQSNYTFFYDDESISNIEKINIDIAQATVSEIMDACLENTAYDYNIVDNTVILFKSEEKVKELLKVEVKGKVTDNEGKPLPGATIMIKGTYKGITTDTEGDYTIIVPYDETVLVFSYVGFIRQEIKVGDKTTINVTLEQAISQLEDVVVIGYGSVARKDLTGSVSTIKSEDLVTQATLTSFDQLLGGKTTGVLATQISGKPGAGAIINIRGQSALKGDNQPLYVIDGIPVLASDNVPSSFAGGLGAIEQANPLAAINPNDIESVDILKDASAAAIYGSRAANGVVIITTKRGSKGDDNNVQVDFNYQVSTQRPVKTYNLMNAAEYKAYMEKVANNTLEASAAGNYWADANFANAILNNERKDYFGGDHGKYFRDSDTDWTKVLSNKPLVHNYNLSARGHAKGVQYSLSTNASNQPGYYVGNNYKSYGVRGTLDIQANKWLTLGTTINYSYNVSNSNAINGANDVLFNPTVGENESAIGRYGTPSSPKDRTKYFNTRKGSNVLANAYAKIKFLKKFEFKSELGVSIFDTKGNNYMSVELATSSTQYPGRKSLLNTHTTNTTFTNTLTYNNKFSEKHNINALVGTAFDIRNLYTYSITFEGFSNDISTAIPGNNLVTSYGTYENKQQTFLNSFFLRANYNYDSKYYLTFTGRVDGSDKFGPNNRYGFFPSVAASWRLSKEEFLTDVKFLDDLKLKASLGITGNNSLQQFQFVSVYGQGGSRNSTTYNGVNGLISLVLPNPDIHWETTKQFDVSMDFALFNYRLNGTIGYYNKSTKDIIAYPGVPLTTGFVRQIENTATIRNSGIEIEINGDIIRKKDFRWNSAFNISFNKNELVALNGSDIFATFSPNSLREGYPLGALYGYEVEGIFSSQEEIDAYNALSSSGRYSSAPFIGNYIYKDNNGDGKITRDDRTVLGNTNPDYFGGWSNTLTYKGFSLYFDFQFTVGHQYENGFDSFVKTNYSGYDQNNVKDVFADTWTPENTDAHFQWARFGGVGYGEYGTNSRSVYDASYLRFKTLRFGYQLPKSLIEKLNLRSVALSISANNLYTWTKWPGLDPEVVTSSNLSLSTYNTTRVLNSHPVLRTFTFGINIGL